MVDLNPSINYGKEGINESLPRDPSYRASTQRCWLDTRWVTILLHAPGVEKPLGTWISDGVWWVWLMVAVEDLEGLFQCG